MSLNYLWLKIFNILVLKTVVLNIFCKILKKYRQESGSLGPSEIALGLHSAACPKYL